jgi:hypothetical protein
MLMINSLHIIYYPTIKRLTSSQVVNLTLSGTSQLDLVLLSLGIVAGTIFLTNSFLKKQSLNKLLQFFKSYTHSLLTYFFILLIVIEIGSLLRWITYPIYPTQIYGDWTWHFAKLQTQLFYTIGSFSPLLMALLILCWISYPVLRHIIRMILRLLRLENNKRKIMSKNNTKHTILSFFRIDGN